MSNNDRGGKIGIAPMYESTYGFHTKVNDRTLQSLEEVLAFVKALKEPGGLLTFNVTKKETRTKSSSPHAWINYQKPSEFKDEEKEEGGI
jgi:hypothetical protein